MNNRLQGAMVAVARVRAAVGSIESLPESFSREIEEWLLLAAEPAENDAATDLAAAVTARRDCVTLEAVAGVGALRERLLAYFEDVNASPDAVARFGALSELARARTLGHWLELRPSSLSRGWFAVAEIPLPRARTAADPTAKNELLGTWAESHGMAICTRMGRSLGEGNPFAALRLPLPGSGVEAIDVGLSAFAALSIPLLSSDLADALRLAAVEGDAGPRPAELDVWLTARGVSRLGILVERPTRTAMIRLCKVAGAASELDGLARFEGAVGAQAPAAIECAMLGSGPAVAAHYDRLVQA